MDFKDFYKKHQTIFMYSQSILGIPVGWYVALKDLYYMPTLNNVAIICFSIAFLPYLILFFEELKTPFDMLIFPINFTKFLFRKRI